MKNQPHYITIEEKRVFNKCFDGTVELELVRSTCIQRGNSDFSKNICRVYEGISEASILRLAKIQEELAG